MSILRNSVTALDHSYKIKTTIFHPVKLLEIRNAVFKEKLDNPHKYKVS